MSRGGGGMTGGHVALEELPPCRVDTGAIGEVLLVDLVDEPFIGAEARRIGSS